jgi:hypothetical protein
MELIHRYCERDISKQKINRLNMGVKTKNFQIVKKQHGAQRRRAKTLN